MLPSFSSVGLFVARQAIEHGLVPTVFEASARVGGVWARHWTTLTTNSSVSMMSLVEPPMELPYRTFPKKGAIVDYVERYEPPCTPPPPPVHFLRRVRVPSLLTLHSADTVPLSCP